MPVHSNSKLKLEEEIMKTVVDSGLSYKQALNALNYVAAVLRDKGDNLLDAVNIQEVAKVERFSR